jgi:uncharacterized membrane protein YfcA
LRPKASVDPITVDLLLMLVAVAAVAGFVDAVAGGGGLLALPALLWAGLPPIQALATNKLQGSFGTFAAAAHFVRHGHADLRRLAPAIALTFIGAAAGTLMVQRLDSEFLSRLVPLLLLGFAIYFLFSPRLARQDRRRRTGLAAFAVLVGCGVGFYDGFFGPGTGTFFAAGFVLLLGYDLTRATAGTKVLNFTSNLASLLFFAAAGEVLWTVGIAMGLAQTAGAMLGARMVIRHGARLVRPLLVLVSVALSITLLLEN